MRAYGSWELESAEPDSSMEPQPEAAERVARELLHEIMHAQPPLPMPNKQVGSPSRSQTLTPTLTLALALALTLTLNQEALTEALTQP